MPEQPSARAHALMLAGLMQSLYLSTACAAGDHTRCRLVDKYRGLPCCCTVCDHTDLDGSPPPACTPLLHYAEDGPQPGYTYGAGQPLGVRDDFVEAIAKGLASSVHELRRPGVAYEAAVAAALALAPRSGA